MDIKNVTIEFIGKKVKGIFTGMEVVGTITGIIDDKYCAGVKISLDTPVNWGGSFYHNYESTARKWDGWGNLNHTELI